MMLLSGTLLTQGRCTVAAALWASGNNQAPNWSCFYQLLNQGRWPSLAVSRQLFLLIIEMFVPSAACVERVIDESLERRWGSKISMRGHYRNSAHFSREYSFRSPVLRWIVMAVVLSLPWTKQRWALPFLCVLAMTSEVSERLGRRQKTIGMWAYQIISLVRRWLSNRHIKPMGDTPYSVLELGLNAQDHRLILVRTGCLDAMLHEVAPQYIRYRIGRPSAVGQRLPSLEQDLQNPENFWQQLTLDWYSEGELTVEFCAGGALWYLYNADPLPIRWMLTRDSKGKRPQKVIFSIDPNQTTEQIVRDKISRWSREVTFEERRAHLGIEMQRQWSDRAIECSTPLIFGLYSLVTLFGQAVHPDRHIPVTQAAWYLIHTATFLEVFIVVGQYLRGYETFPTSPTDLGIVLVLSSNL